MPVIAFSSPKGGAGKTTAATLIATELAQINASVTIIDADPNRNVVDWAKLPGLPDNLKVIGDVGEETIAEAIEAAAATSTFVIIDLEGTASLLVSYAVAMSDLVIIPVQGSQLDAKQAARQIRLIQGQEKVIKRPIPFLVLLTRMSPAITPKTTKHIVERFMELHVPVMHARLYDREAYRALFSYGGTLEGLRSKGVSNLDAAINNARIVLAEIVTALRDTGRAGMVKTQREPAEEIA